jgi:serine/threonine protein kinase
MESAGSSYSHHRWHKTRKLRNHGRTWVGGTGDGYQATDSKLGRSVAIKFLPGEFSHDTERVARFQREERVLASLNRPGIAAIYDIEGNQ